ncbi:NUDIX hydrolase [Lentilactobacillus hilgardii]|uniref:NUDIX domain-containing protein n=1 Tax=Lentilactobacillus hilgardii TaxID=1588 RepID=A0A6P1E629_LENHI|nr:NUDIX domain-containing protein [Lentilactobacillus hilgardii]EEI71528.1 hydrolase, NUDIX family [Lentilactobacillus hilgardii ATCC 27305]MCT3392112.1 NUDIX domain-containing protein [Lentilactobacillus hilgardii]QHB51570.1 NUDIX domain-containing protein [Lentilactobacillus hilgardii]RRG12321.1 MAG: NUDIX domain-containing protein [Lactobacillus sp.]
MRGTDMDSESILEQPYINITNIIWSFDQITSKVNILLVKRSNKPYNGYWALPETFMRTNESADEAALRLVRAKIGMALSNSHTEQLATFTNRLRTPEQRTLSLAYMTFLPDKPMLKPGYGASDARWFSMDYTENGYAFSDGELTFSTAQSQTESQYYAKLAKSSLSKAHLAYDHEWILKVACERIKNKLDYQPNILLVLGPQFTLKDARLVYAPFLKMPFELIDNSNFKKSHRHLFTDVGTSMSNRPGRPARVYKLSYLFP